MASVMLRPSEGVLGEAPSRTISTVYALGNGIIRRCSRNTFSTLRIFLRTSRRNVKNNSHILERYVYSLCLPSNMIAHVGNRLALANIDAFLEARAFLF